MGKRWMPILLVLGLLLVSSAGCAGQAAAEPTATSTPRPTFTDVPPPTNTPTAAPTLPPTDTPEPPTPTATHTPEPTATRPPPPPTAVPPTATPEPQVGPHGIIGRLRLSQPKEAYGVGERVFFTFEAENTTGGDVPFGILGLKADHGPDFGSSWTSDVYQWYIPANGVFKNDDHLVFSAPGTYNVKLCICYDTFGACRSGSTNWVEYSPGVTLTVR